MGLIKMFTSAVGSTFADQVVEYFRCEDMSTKILCQPATLVKRGKTVNNGTEGVISNGSRFDVAVNQAALLIETAEYTILLSVHRKQQVSISMIQLYLRHFLAAAGATLALLSRR